MAEIPEFLKAFDTHKNKNVSDNTNEIQKENAKFKYCRKDFLSLGINSNRFYNIIKNLKLNYASYRVEKKTPSGSIIYYYNEEAMNKVKQFLSVEERKDVLKNRITNNVNTTSFFDNYMLDNKIEDKIDEINKYLDNFASFNLDKFSYNEKKKLLEVLDNFISEIKTSFDKHIKLIEKDEKNKDITLALDILKNNNILDYSKEDDNIEIKINKKMNWKDYKQSF